MSDLHILTAAQCVHAREAGQLVAMLGLHSLLSPHSAVANIRSVEISSHIIDSFILLITFCR